MISKLLINHSLEYEAKTIKLLQENIGAWGVQGFLGNRCKCIYNITQIGKFDFTKIEHFWSLKDTFIKVKSNPQTGKSILNPYI